MIFKHMDHLKILFTEIGKIFLCNIQINEEIVHTDVENFMILGYKVDEKNINHINWAATMFGLQSTAETPGHLGANLDLSNSEEEEDEKSMEPLPSFLAVNNDAFDFDRVVNSFNDDKNTSPFEIGPEKNDDIKDFLMTNLKKEVSNEEKDFLSQETTKIEKKKNGGKHTSRRSGGKRKKTEEDEEEKKKKKMRKEDIDFKQIKNNIEEMEMKNSDMELLAKHLDENTQGTLKTAKKLINENVPKIHETF